MSGKKIGFLKGVRILDLADEKGSLAGRLLADLGAEITRVDTPQVDAQKQPGGSPEEAPLRLSFLYSNIHKKNIRLTLHTEEGKQIFERLVRRTDALITTAPVGYLESLNLGPSRLQQVNPRMVHLFITAFGLTGPKRWYASSATTASASGGQMFACRDGSGRPVPLCGQQPFYTASLFGAISILLNLRKRAITGTGGTMDLSVQEAVASTLDHALVDHFSRGGIPRCRNGYGYDPNFPVLPCRDGYMQLTILQNWETLIEILEAENSAGDLSENRWRDPAFREEHFSHVVEGIKRWTMSHTRKELLELGQAMRFPWAPVAEPAEVLESAQLDFRHFFIRTAAPTVGTEIILPGIPYIFRACAPMDPGPGPAPGKEPAQILNEIASGKTSMKRGQAPASSDHCPEGHILKGVRVLDLTRMVAGPCCTRILADFGAEVVKVQTEKMATGADRNDTPYFRAWNRNKRSVSLNLDLPEARECFLKLVGDSHIVVENFSPRVMANWRLQYDRLTTANPSLIMLSLSAMGQTGPWKDYVGFGPTFHAFSGLSAASTDAPGYPPVHIGHAYGDILAGLYGALAILAALRWKEKTGTGRHIDLSGYEAVCTFLGPALMRIHSTKPSEPEDCRTPPHEEEVPDQCYPCSGDDRWCAVTVRASQWDTFCTIVDDPGLQSEIFSTKAGRMGNLEELNSRIRDWTSRHSAEAVEETLQKAGIAAHVVENTEDVSRDIQLNARHFFAEVDHPVTGKTTVVRSALWPWQTCPEWHPAPGLGEANYDIFVRRLGLPKATYREYVQRGVFR